MGFSFRNASALSILVGTAVAQGTKIFGCADVDCPTKGDTAINECTVANSTFINVGVAPITADDDLGPIAGFSWVQGMDEHGDSNNASRRVFETSFLLATPPSFYDERYGDRKACAALFHDLTEVSSDTNSACSAIEGACLEALRERATNLRFGDGDDPCERLGEDLRRNFDSECRGLLSDGINKWPELTVRTIDGPGSIRPISDQANSSSNCWPVTEKESNLAFIEFRSESTDDYGPGPILDWMGRVTPMLTVVYGDRDGEDPVAQMSCIRAVDSSTVSEKNKNSGGDENPPNGAISSHLPGIGAVLGAAVSVGTLNFLFAQVFRGYKP